MIYAQYIFTLSIDDDGKQYIECTYPPHNLKTEEGLLSLEKEISSVYSYCENMYIDCHRMLLELQEQGNVATATKKQQKLSQ